MTTKTIQVRRNNAHKESKLAALTLPEIGWGVLQSPTVPVESLANPVPRFHPKQMPPKATTFQHYHIRVAQEMCRNVKHLTALSVSVSVSDWRQV
jgi:hypothetical protein